MSSTLRFRGSWTIKPLVLTVILSLIAALVVSVLSGIYAGDSVVAHAARRPPISQLKPGTVVHAATCDQAPSQKIIDRATYTPQELAQYGLPPLLPSESFAKWAQIVRTAGTRVCDYTISGDRWATGVQNPGWSGWVAKQSGTDTYTESDLDFYVPCAQTSPSPVGWGSFGSWVGIGGYLNGGTIKGKTFALMQAGVALHQYYASPGGWINWYQIFWENTANTSNSNANYGFTVNCNDHIYAKVYDTGGSGCAYIQRISDGKNEFHCLTPSSDEQSAEAIVEKNYDVSYPYFPKFSSQTFYGVGFTDNGQYKGFLSIGVSADQLVQWYCTLFSTTSNQSPTTGCLTFGEQLASVSSPQNDPGDNPYDEYTVTWLNWGNGYWSYKD